MDANLQRGMLENVDMSSALHQLQGDITKLNTSVLRGIEGGTLHFITVPRSDSQEFIDHSLLSPEYIAAQIQNGLVVDIISAPAHETGHEQNPTHIYQTTQDTGGEQQQQTLLERQYIHDVTMASAQAQIQQEIHLQSPSGNGSVIIEDPDRRLAAAFLQYVQKEAPQLITNETQVIVSNKEMATLTPLTEADKQIHVAGNFVTSIDNDHLINQHFLHENSAMKLFQTGTTTNTVSNNIEDVPPLPPLTPINKLPVLRRTRELQQVIQYKSNVDTQNVGYKRDNLDGELMDIAGHTIRTVNGDTTHLTTVAPKKTLPHKKRISKKLKSINQDDQILISNGSIGQEMLTTQHGVLLHTNSKNDGKVFQNFNLDTTQTQHTTSSTILPQYSCELCGLQCSTQLDFFSHLKQHYEPQPMDDKTTDDNSLENELRSHTQLELANVINNHQINVNGTTNRTVITEPFSMLSNGHQQNMHHSNNNDSVNTYNDALNTKFDSVKSEENEFSDTEDMLEGGVVDKVQDAVDNYIENNSNEVNDIITLTNPQNQINIAIDGEEKDWYQTSSMSNNIVFQTNELSNDKVDGGLLVSDSSLGSQHSYQQTQAQTQAQNHSIHGLIEPIANGNDTNDMVIYEISEINDKSLPEGYAVVENGDQGLVRREMLKPPMELLNNYQVVVKNEAEADYTFDSIIDYQEESCGEDEDGQIEVVPAQVSKPTETRTLSLRDIQDEFIEEEKTDSDTTERPGGGPRKKRKFYRCKRCNKLCNSKNALHYHFLNERGERPHQCEICGKSFFASSALKVHKRLHSGDKPYQCDHCKRPFRQWGDLKYHIQSRHTAEKNHQCEFCGKDFARRYSLVIHRRIHTGEKNYKCEFCDKEFRASSYLQVHRKIHTGEKPHECTECGKKFRVRGDLKRHSTIHTRDNKAKEDKNIDINVNYSAFDLSSAAETSSSSLSRDNSKPTEGIEHIGQQKETSTSSTIKIFGQTFKPMVTATASAPIGNRNNVINGKIAPKTKRKPSKKATVHNVPPLTPINQSTMTMKSTEIARTADQVNKDAQLGSVTMTNILHSQKTDQILPNTSHATIVIKSNELDAQQQFVNWPIVSYMS